jgi:hypothetical protein
MTALWLDVTATPFHRRYLSLVEHIERAFPVARWISGDVEVWPLARLDLYLDMYWANVGGELPKSVPFVLRALDSAATPLKNVWKSRNDFRHLIMRPKAADTIFLGDGVSMDLVDGAWQDRYCEPVIAALERRGLRTFLMQSGDLSRLPWHRPTFAANLVALRGGLGRFTSKASADLPELGKVLEFLSEKNVHAPSLSRPNLERRANIVAATASAFENVLRRVKPSLAFVVTYYSGLGPAFMLACRRQGVLSIDLQHCPQEGAHKAYGWLALPENGYAILPAVFWTWTRRDAADIQRWASTLTLPWHRSVHGGHTQLSPYLDDADRLTRAGDAKFAAMTKGTDFEREILVALQPVGGYREQWDALAAQIEASPSTWRWWIRRHPASTAYQDVEFKRLISLRGPNLVVNESSSLMLPVLLRHMSVVVSRFSGASAEAAALGVPSIFLSEEARGQFSNLIDQGFARIIDIESLNTTIAAMPAEVLRPAPEKLPEIEHTLDHLAELARDYSRLFRGRANQPKIRTVGRR